MHLPPLQKEMAEPPNQMLESGKEKAEVGWVPDSPSLWVHHQVRSGGFSWENPQAPRVRPRGGEDRFLARP